MLLQKFIFIIFNDFVQKEVNWPHLKKKGVKEGLIATI